MAHRRGHAAHLPVHPLSNRQLDPAGRHRFPESNRHRSIGKVRLPGQSPDLSRSRPGSAQAHASAQLLKGLFVGNTLNLDEIDLGQFVLRVGDAVRQRSVGCQQHQPFAVPVEAAGSIDTGKFNIVRQRRPPLRIRETGQHSVRLVQCNRAGKTGRRSGVRSGDWKFHRQAVAVSAGCRVRMRTIPALSGRWRCTSPSLI